MIDTNACYKKPLIKIIFKPKHVKKCTGKTEQLKDMLHNFSGIIKKDSYIIF